MERDPRLRKIVEKGTEYLGIPTGVQGGGHALSQLMSLKDSPGWVVEGDTVREWKLHSFVRLESEVFLYGPYFSGMSLAQVVEMAPDEAFHYLRRLVNALALLEEKTIPAFDLHMDGVLFSSGDAVLFLPPPVMRMTRVSRLDEAKIESFERLNHPDLRGQDRMSFTLGILAYRILSGKYPFDSSSEDDLHFQMRDLRVLPLSLIVPEIREDVSEFVVRAVGHPPVTNPPMKHPPMKHRSMKHRRRKQEAKEPGISLLDWKQHLRRWEEGGFRRDVSDEERERCRLEAQQKGAKAEKTFRRRLYWTRNGKTVAAVSAVVVLTALVLGSVLRNSLAPRSTKGYQPREVVEAFYNGFNRLDHQLMEDCVVEGAAKQEVTEVVNLFVLFNMMSQYETAVETYVPADIWDERGRPALRESTVYGLARLSVREESAEPDPQYVVEYEKWAPRSTREETDPSALPYEGFAMRDRVYLKKDGDDWVIYQVDRLSTESLKPPAS